MAGNIVIFFFNDPAAAEIYTLSLHDALPISGTGGRTRTDRATGSKPGLPRPPPAPSPGDPAAGHPPRSEEHTSELQSQSNLVCRLLLEKKKKTSPVSCRSEQSLVALFTHAIA